MYPTGPVGQKKNGKIIYAIQNVRIDEQKLVFVSSQYKESLFDMKHTCKILMKRFSTSLYICIQNPPLLNFWKVILGLILDKKIRN